MTPEQRTLKARRAAHLLHAQGLTNTGPARAAFLRKFEDQVDPDRSLPESIRQTRAKHALDAHMLGLRLSRSK